MWTKANFTQIYSIGLGVPLHIGVSLPKAVDPAWFNHLNFKTLKFNYKVEAVVKKLNHLNLKVFKFNDKVKAWLNNLTTLILKFNYKVKVVVKQFNHWLSSQAECGMHFMQWSGVSVEFFSLKNVNFV